MLWKGFQRPKRLECDLESLTPTYGKFYAQPFERGFGTTIGNALRRVLLSSIEGAAITAVKIEGVLHEFTSIPGVVEDTIDLILNLKQIPLKLNVNHPETIYLRAEGAMEVKAGNIESNPNVEILDPEVHIATLSEEGRLNIEMRVKPGRGYVAADRNFDTDLSRSEEHTSELQSPYDLVCRLLLTQTIVIHTLSPTRRSSDLSAGRGGDGGQGRQHREQPQRRDPRSRGAHRHAQRGRTAEHRDACEAGPRLRRGRSQLRHRPVEIGRAHV